MTYVDNVGAKSVASIGRCGECGPQLVTPTLVTPLGPQISKKLRALTSLNPALIINEVADTLVKTDLVSCMLMSRNAKSKPSCPRRTEVVLTGQDGRLA